jgi:hypothetical protein
MQYLNGFHNRCQWLTLLGVIFMLQCGRALGIISLLLSRDKGAEKPKQRTMNGGNHESFRRVARQAVRM